MAHPVENLSRDHTSTKYAKSYIERASSAYSYYICTGFMCSRLITKQEVVTVNSRSDYVYLCKTMTRMMILHSTTCTICRLEDIFKFILFYNYTLYNS